MKKNIFESNIEGLQQVLNFASQKKKIKKFIFASSASIYGDTKNIKVKENFNADQNITMLTQSILVKK